MNYIKVILLFNLIVFLSSCGTVKKAFSNQKKNGSDEFLVKKKSPLVMPPDYDELPVPQLKENQNKKNDNNVKKLITNSEIIIDETTQTDDLNDNLEETILKKIKN